MRQDEVESATQFAIEGTMKVSIAKQARAKAPLNSSRLRMRPPSTRRRRTRACSLLSAMAGVAGRAAQLVADAPSGFDEPRGSVDIGELLA